jgi:hypothetical protein
MGKKVSIIIKYVRWILLISSVNTKVFDNYSIFSVHDLILSQLPKVKFSRKNTLL